MVAFLGLTALPLFDVAQIVGRGLVYNRNRACRLSHSVGHSYSTYILETSPFHWASPTMKEAQYGIVLVDDLCDDEETHVNR